MNTGVAAASWLMWTMLLWTQKYKYLFKILLSILEICLEVGLLDHLLIPFLIFEDPRSCLPKQKYYFIFPPTVQCTRFQFLHLLANTCHFLSFLILVLFYCQFPLSFSSWFYSSSQSPGLGVFVLFYVYAQQPPPPSPAPIDLIQTRSCKHHALYYTSQISILVTSLATDLQTHIFNYLLNLYTWMGISDLISPKQNF